MNKKLRDILFPLLILGATGLTAAWTLSACGLHPAWEVPPMVIVAGR